MQKILRINAQARKQAVKDARYAIQKKQKKADKEYWDYQHYAARSLGQRSRAERKARREDWLAGPLAPDRDSGLDRGALGSLSAQALQARARPDPKTKKSLSGNRPNIVQGDRVVVIKGQHKGSIGEVIEVNKDHGSVTIQGMHTADIRVPAFQRLEMRERKITAMDLPISVEDVRLVFKPEDSNQDVVVRYITGGDPEYVREFGSQIPEHTRYIAGTDIEIPWPTESIPDQERGPDDTPRLSVDYSTHIPSIMNSPFAASIADELIPKFRLDRVQHEDTYVARKILEDARSLWYESRRLTTPAEQKLEQLARKRQVLEEKNSEQWWKSLQEEIAPEAEAGSKSEKSQRRATRSTGTTGTEAGSKATEPRVEESP